MAAEQLHALARDGDDEALLDLLGTLPDAPAAIDAARSAAHQTPLHTAAYFGHELAARVLVGAGADKDALDRNGETPLHLACKWPHDKVRASVGHAVCYAMLHTGRRWTWRCALAMTLLRGSWSALVRMWTRSTATVPLHLANTVQALSSQVMQYRRSCIQWFALDVAHLLTTWLWTRTRSALT
jgi:hypothetical protein